MTSNRTKVNGIKIRLKMILLFFHCLLSKDPELREITKQIIKLRHLRIFPYDFPEKYKQSDIDVYYDMDGYPYVIRNGEKLFLKKEWTKEQCQEFYNEIRIEQDINSPHRYITTNDRAPLSSDIVADIGAAEGFFSLDVIKKVEKIYIFEADDQWLIPLHKTFDKWGEKVEIVHKYVSEIDDDINVSLDTFFKGRNVTYIKADIEGAEEKMISGAKYVLNYLVNKVVICTYHRNSDEKKMSSLISKLGFDVTFNKGYMIFFYDDSTFKYPYIRRGVMFGIKPNNNIDKRGAIKND